MEVLNYDHFIDDNEIVFMTYVGFITQTLLTGMVESLEHEKEFSDIPSNCAHNIFTVFIEMTQNIIKYAKSEVKKESSYKSNGLIVVGKYVNKNYFVHSQNVVFEGDIETISKRIDEINKLSSDEIRKKYRELRRNGRHLHDKGAGIGFYEIAKRAVNIEYKFTKLNDDKYYFYLTAEIKE